MQQVTSSATANQSINSGASFSKESLPNPLTQTFGREGTAQITSAQSLPTQTGTGGGSPTKSIAPNKAIEKLNKQAKASLPPGVEGISYGSMFVEVGQMEWFTYDNVNYLSENGGDTKPIVNLFANFKFWGEQSKGIYLKCQNGMKKGEKVTNKFRYEVRTPEKTFERYLDDMGVLVVDFFDTVKNQTVGTSKIMIKLYIKRAKREDDEQPLLELRGSFPITLTGNQNIKIGQFQLTMVTSFPVAQRGTGAPNIDQPLMNSNEESNEMLDSFIVNERRAEQLAQQEKNRKIHDKIFQDDRVPISLQGRSQNEDYKSGKFLNNDLDERPSRERPQASFKVGAGKENQRNKINIDENEDTFSNQDELAKILARGQRLKDQMNQAMDSDNVWEALHGPHVVPKKYVPPFLQKDRQASPKREEEIDRIYEIEIEGYDQRALDKDPRRQQIEQEDAIKSVSPTRQNPTGNLTEMKFLKIKIVNLRVDNEELLHQLIDNTFTMIVEVPLPDIYQKKLSNQSVKLSNYDVVAFNEFAYNSSSLYNFKVDEETLSKFIQSNLKVTLEGLSVTGNLSMTKLVMAKNYKLEITIPLERQVKQDDLLLAAQQKAAAEAAKKADNKKGGKGAAQKKGKETAQPTTVKSLVDASKSYSHQVGKLTIELSLQRGETDEEIEREYQIKIQKLLEQKAREEEQKTAELQKYLKYTQQQEPAFASLYLYINEIRNLQISQDGTLIPQIFKNPDDTIIERQVQGSETIETHTQIDDSDVPLGPKRNLYVQYKGFPGRQTLKTQVVWKSRDPKFQYRCQEAIIVNPDIIEKLERFTFILEVWDQSQPSKEEFLGLVKIPLASFVYSMRTNNEQIYSLNFLADQHCLYPMIITDGFQPIYSPRLGQNIGELSVTLALGSSIQINRQIQKEQDIEKQQIELQMKNKIQQAMRKAQKSTINEFGASFPPPQQMRPPTPPTPKTPEKKEEPNPLLNNQLFASIGKFFNEKVSVSRDIDYRKLTFLSCLRKLFEEARQAGLQEINGQSELFKEMPKNFDGTIKKDDFVYAILNNKTFTLTRTEIANIAALIPVQKDGRKGDGNNNIELEDLQRSYRAYLNHYQSVEGSIHDLLERIYYLVQRKITDPEQFEEFVQQIEKQTKESKIPTSELRDLFDNNGIPVLDSQMNQLSIYFDLDRNDQLYSQSLIEYLRNPRMQNFNFFKVHPVIIQNLVSGSIKEEITSDPATLGLIEQDLKREFFKKYVPATHQELNPDQTGEFEAGIIPPPIIDEGRIPDDILVEEKISASLFQTILHKHGVQLSQWCLFTLFDSLNTTLEPRLFQEPQRYHFLSSFGHFYRFITNLNYEAKLREDALRREQREKEERMRRDFEEQQQQMILQQQALMKASMENALELAGELNKKKENEDSEGGLYSNKSYDQVTERDDENDEVVTKKKRKRKEMTFADNKNTDDTEEDDYTKVDNRPFKKIKHIFEIQVKELKNIPILDKLIKDLNAIEHSKTQHSKQPHNLKRDQNKSRYIQNVAVKYSFPLDEDEIFQSDFIQLNTDVLHDISQYDYKVSINTVHNYLMNKEDPIQKLLKNANASTSHSDQMTLFNISVVIYDGNKEFVIGNAQIAIEDLIDMVDTYHSQITNGVLPPKQTLSRVVFIYGTTYSQRENCIIGKMQIEINYQIEKQILPQSDSSVQKQPVDGQQPSLILNETQDANPTCFLHRETFIKRKIPLNAVLSVEIERINNLKESLENIEHFSKIQMSAYKDEKVAASSHRMSAMSASHLSKNTGVIQSKEQTDRRRILTQIFKNGLNLVVIGSIFDEDHDLKKKFPIAKHTSRILFNTLTPIFNEGFEIGIQMDTQIFEYLKNKKAIFEVRHYIIDSDKRQSSNVQMSNHKSESSVSHRSYNTEENEERDLMNDNDFIILGYVRVPLLHLITKNNGIDGDFVIFDDYKQQMGSLKLRISLNHHSSKRPLYSQTNKVANTKDLQDASTIFDQKGTMIDKTVKLTNSLLRSSKNDYNQLVNGQQYMLGLNFVELVFRNRNLQVFGNNDQSFMYLKFKLGNQSYQTKFISNLENVQNTVYQKQLGLNVFEIKKMVFIELDFLKQEEIEEAFSRPLEVQLWAKKEHSQRYLQPEMEQHLGSFFIELNDLGKMKNKRVKDANGVLQSYEGYFSLFDFQRQQVVPDRLGCKILMIKKEYDGQMADLEVLFHNLTEIERVINEQFDTQVKGCVEADELISEVAKQLQDPYQSLLVNYIRALEYKNPEKIYYSPLFGPLPPFFRYAKRFDSFSILERFARELQSIDTHSTGFIPVNLFRSILEHELKIKEKIVLEFINGLRETDQQGNVQSLDLNVATNSLRAHIDYVTLLHKLSFYFSQLRAFSEDVQVPPSIENTRESVTLRIDIESAMRLRHPFNELDVPNSFVQLNLPYGDATPKILKTQVVPRSSYPTWHFVNQQVKFTLTQEVLRHIIQYPLEFEVYHTQQTKTVSLVTGETMSQQQIGVAYVDLSQMVFIDGVYSINGYFHIVRKDRFRDGGVLPMVDPHRLSMESLGQIKLSIVSNTNLKRQIGGNPLSQSIARELSPLNNMRRSVDQFMSNGSIHQQNFASRPESSLSNHASQTRVRLEQSFNQVGFEFNNKSEAELKSTLNAKISELDQITKSLQQRAQRSTSPDMISSSQQPPMYQPTQNFGMTIGHSTNQEMRSSFQPFAYHPRVGGAYHFQGTQPFMRVEDYPSQQMMQQPSEIAEEADEVEGANRAGLNDESFHRENVFENNISRGTSSHHSSAQRQQEVNLQMQDNLALNEELQQPLGGQGTGQFPREYYDTFNQHQLNLGEEGPRTMTTTNVFAEPIHLDTRDLVPQLQRLSVTEHDDEDETQTQHQSQHPHIITSVDGGNNPKPLEIADDEADEAELKRIEKILKRQGGGNKFPSSSRGGMSEEDA